MLKIRQFVDTSENKEGPAASVSPEPHLVNLTYDALQVRSTYFVAPYCIVTVLMHEVITVFVHIGDQRGPVPQFLS